MKLTDRQMDLLKSAEKTGSYGVLPSFISSAKALEKRGYILHDRKTGNVYITEAGRSALKESRK